MTIYVAEIDGRPIAAFHAELDIAAEDMAEAEWFKRDLMVLEREGKSLWKGTSNIHVREAVDEELATWEASFAKAVLEGEATPDEKDGVFYLVGTLVDPR